MRRLSILLSLVVLTSALASAQPGAAGVSFGVFYSSLGSYGEWLHVSGGVYAWHPEGVRAGWRPYLDGRWLWTDDGWFWSSEEPWGWATYHYGRWYFDDYYGWVWVPGYEWAPAWVEWRYGGGCVGWAPLSPYALFSAGWGIHYTAHWNTPFSYWTFVDCRYINRPFINDYAYRGEDNSRWIGRTRGAGSIGFDGGRIITRGPGRDYVERTGNIRVQRTDLVPVDDHRGERLVRGPNGREQIHVYRPPIDGRANREGELRPSRVRATDHPFSLDFRQTDIGRRDVARDQGRDLRRAEEYRRRQFETTSPGVARPEEHRLSPAPAPGGRNTTRGWMDNRQRNPGKEVLRAPDQRREPIERSPRIERKEVKPERTVRPPAEHRSQPSRDGDRTTGHGRGGNRR